MKTGLTYFKALNGAFLKSRITELMVTPPSGKKNRGFWSKSSSSIVFAGHK
jgi:hypothetical protein